MRCPPCADARSDIFTDLEFDEFEKFVGRGYADKGIAPSAEAAMEFGLALHVVDHNPPIDPRCA
jgi:hypothetical protein